MPQFLISENNYEKRYKLSNLNGIDYQMENDRFKRKLTAILSADVKGYSRLMGEDEEATVQTLQEYRRVMSGLIEQHRGLVVDSPGDNLLAEFASVVDSVRCAWNMRDRCLLTNSARKN